MSAKCKPSFTILLHLTIISIISLLALKLDSRFIHFQINSKIPPQREYTSNTINIQPKSRHIVLIHPRKAGGTALFLYLRAFLSRLQNNLNITHNMTHNISLIHREAWLWSHSKVNFIEHTLTDYPHALYIAVFREPVDRILSQYEFEWRWGCQMCNEYSYIEYMNNSDNEQQYNSRKRFWREHENREHYNMSEEILKHKFNNIEFNYFLDVIEDSIATNRFDFNPHPNKEFASKATYLNNYYLWIFCCDRNWCTTYGNNSINMNQCLINAIDIVSKLDVVLITSWLSDMRIRMYLHKVLTDYLDAVLDVEYDKSALLINLDAIQREAKRPDMFLTQGHSRMISKDNYIRLRKWNKWDNKLYAYAQNLSYQKIQTTLV